MSWITLFKKKREGHKKPPSGSVSLCLSCTYAVKGGYLEDYFCDAWNKYVPWDEVDLMVECQRYERIGTIHSLIRCPKCGSDNVTGAYGSRRHCKDCGHVFT